MPLTRKIGQFLLVTTVGGVVAWVAFALCSESIRVPIEGDDRIAANALMAQLRMFDGRTAHFEVAECLETLGHLGESGAGHCAEELSVFLGERSQLYKERDRYEVNRLRSFMMLTLSRLGGHEAASSSIIDQLVNSDRPYARAAAARVVGHLGSNGKIAIPQLIAMAGLHGSDAVFSLERYNQFDFPESEATTEQLEAIRALGRLGPLSRAAIPLLTRLAQYDDERSGNHSSIVAASSIASLKLICSGIPSLPPTNFVAQGGEQ